jgi:hypothetical protein
MTEPELLEIVLGHDVDNGLARRASQSISHQLQSGALGQSLSRLRTPSSEAPFQRHRGSDGDYFGMKLQAGV